MLSKPDTVRFRAIRRSITTGVLLILLALFALTVPDLRKVLYAQGYYDADLSVTLVGLSLPAVAGEGLEVTIAVRNLALNPADSVAVVSSLDSDLEFESTLGCAEDPGGFPVCSLGDLPSGEQFELGLKSRIESSASGSQALTLVAISPTGDANPLNDSLALDVPVSRQADLAVELDNGVSFFSNDEPQPLDYLMTVRNNGPSDANGVQLAFQPPSIYEAERWFCFSDAGVACTPFGSGSPFETLNAVAGGSALFLIEGILDPSGEGTLSAQAVVTGAVDAVDPSPSNNVARDVDIVGLFADGFEVPRILPPAPSRGHVAPGAWLAATDPRRAPESEPAFGLAARLLDVEGRIMGLVLERRHGLATEVRLIAIEAQSNTITARTPWLQGGPSVRFRVFAGEHLTLETASVATDGQAIRETGRIALADPNRFHRIIPGARWR